MLELQCKTFLSLNVNQLHDLLALRSEVFVVEQTCVYQDIDGKDPASLHVLGTINNKIVAYARILPRGESYMDYSSIGRIVVSTAHRNKQLGHRLVSFSIEACKKNFPKDKIKISAQSHLEEFYNAHNFKSSGESYLEDGIPHIGMILKD